MWRLLSLVFAYVAYNHCAPLSNSPKRLFKEAEYDVALKSLPGEKRYFIKSDEIPVYEQQFQKIKELGEEINCKIHGNCENGEKRGKISTKSSFRAQKKTIYDKDFVDSLNQEIGRSDNLDDEKKDLLGIQKDASQFGQQPQMDIKMSPQEQAAIQAGFGTMSGSTNEGPVGPPPPISGNDALLKMQEQNNADVIQESINSKMNFMDSANKGMMGSPFLPGLTQGMMGGSIPGLVGGGGGPGMPGVPMGMEARIGDGPSSPSEGRDDLTGVPAMPGNSVSENEIMKAEDVQPNEMQGISNFLKNSNQMDKPSEDNTGENEEPPELEKTNVDFGGAQASIENSENNQEHVHSPGSLESDRMTSQIVNGPVRPGSVEVPTLNNLGLGMNPAEMGPVNSPMGENPIGGSPDLKFMEQNARQMIDQNSDYKVPNSAFNNLWNSYLSSTQSQLGEKDPSANSRGSIFRPEKPKEGKLHRRSNVEKVENGSKKATINSTKNQKFVYVPAFVIKNVLKQIKKNLLPNKTKKSNQPPVYITEKQGKRYLVINPESPLIQGFANVDNQFTSFSIPEFSSNTLVNNMPTIPMTMGMPITPPVFSTSPVFNSPPVAPISPGGLNLEGLTILGGQFPNSYSFGNHIPPKSLFRGFVTVPLFSKVPTANFGSSIFNHLSSPSFSSYNFGPFDYHGGGVRYDNSRNPLFSSYQERWPDSDRISHDFDYHSPSYPLRNVDDSISLNYRPIVWDHNVRDRNIAQQDHYTVDDQSEYEEQEDHQPLDQSNFGESLDSSYFRTNQYTRKFTPEPFSNEYNRDGSVRTQFENDPFNSYLDATPFKRTLQEERPYVFTKDHIGFGPITVEAKTANAVSSKDEDPKDDD